MEVFDSEKETIEELGREGFRLIQSREGFRFGEDTVLLSWFVASNLRVRPSRPLRVLELGTNCGAASVLLAARRKDIRIDGVERQSESRAIFERNVVLNGLSDRVGSFLSDVRDLPTEDLPANQYDAVFMNPPFRSPEQGPVTSESIHGRALLEARFSMHGGVEEFLNCARKMLTSCGDLFLVDRAETLTGVMEACLKNHLIPKRITFVHPYADREATLFLLSARKGGKVPGTVITPPLILRDSEGGYTEQWKKIYE
ncbi:MAG: methyltransferase [Clostridiales bacterium]|nr:methyltransferase [Clostridiales bacterium]